MKRRAANEGRLEAGGMDARWDHIEPEYLVQLRQDFYLPYPYYDREAVYWSGRGYQVIETVELGPMRDSQPRTVVEIWKIKE